MIFIQRETERLPDARPVAILPGEAKTRDAFFAELQVALALPDYFGRNWDALDECLSEMDAVPDLHVRNARTLWQELPREMAIFVDVWLDQAPNAKLIFFW